LSTTRYRPAPGEWENQRQIQSVFELAEQQGSSATALFAPVSFPATPSAGGLLSGLETPDLRGGYGTFTFITNDPEMLARGDRRMRALDIQDGTAEAHIALMNSKELVLRVRPADGLVHILAGDDELAALESGAWTDWIILPTDLGPAVVQFYCKCLAPHVSVYVSPVQFAPGHHWVSQPPEFGRCLAEAAGPYPTCGYPYDTDALGAGVLDDQAFLEHVRLSAQRIHTVAMEAAARNESDLFAVFFLEADAVQHMLWRAIDYTHPLHEESAPHKHAILETYRRLDEVVGSLTEGLGDDTSVYIVSDHGFHSYRMSFDVNRWLLEAGYLIRKAGADAPMTSMYSQVDWAGTRAYSHGMGRISVNLKGRERHGLVNPGSEADALMKELTDRLLAEMDPHSAGTVVCQVWRAGELYSGDRVGDAPDLTLGLQPGYRADSCSVTGGMAEAAITRNHRRWSGDHSSVHPMFVQGVFFSNQRIDNPNCRLVDMAPTILRDLGLNPPTHMDGRPLQDRDDYPARPRTSLLDHVDLNEGR
jgi:predicted AlkP superfamily phosphohydrolase/phosphomutase